MKADGGGPAGLQLGLAGRAECPTLAWDKQKIMAVSWLNGREERGRTGKNRRADIGQVVGNA
jgi:hypothetical protein